MLSQKMIDKLNEQINLEFYSSNLYLQMASWCEAQGLDGCSSFFRKHAQEEMQHMQKLFDYVNETGAMAILGAIDAPPHEYTSVRQVFELTYEHECEVTRSINTLAHTAFSEQDFSSFNFLQWYVAEQHEEEKLFKSILDKIDMIGTESNGLYFIDQEVAKAQTAAHAPRA
ncbi:ferritin [Endozoicomonas montiporae]|uniref:Ferritin n=2 Tax=Endozoicomonas montiporae TaxID=1027273 RepID=A0A081N203_9GAMM|nr:non-heme ferritin [Endozoicomonas montiporae]AMO58572.1 ferritin [Endozoicomonas montiporae CL-33]KEQ12476.1 ferritin [Endozoicomonas montiporae]